MHNILEIKNLSKVYHTPKSETIAVKDFSFDLKNGEFIAIVGPSGCGKSTILNIIGALDNKSHGDIKFNKELKIGYMLQQDALFNWRTVLDNCMLG